jgi:hypothetical protein
MQDINWFQVVIGLISGGAAGALIKHYFDNKKNRIQSIGLLIEIRSIYDAGENGLLNSQIILTGANQEYKFSKLYSGTIEIINTGLHDYSNFDFGITCDESIRFLQVKTISSDRHHKAEISSHPALENQINSFDIVLEPFNRKDHYKFDILLTTTKSEILAENIKISSPKSIRWVNFTSKSDAIVTFANKTFIDLVLIGLRKYY